MHCVIYWQVGVAVGFLIPPVLVPNSDTIDEIGEDLSIMFYAGAGVMTLVFILILIGKFNFYRTHVISVSLIIES